jgi:hypothetical protein
VNVKVEENSQYRMEQAMRLRSTFGAVLFVVALFGIQTNQAAAQFSPGVFADANHPSGPPDPEKEDQIWQVDPLTGALSVTIPFRPHRPAAVARRFPSL